MRKVKIKREKNSKNLEQKANWSLWRDKRLRFLKNIERRRAAAAFWTVPSLVWIMEMCLLCLLSELIGAVSVQLNLIEHNRIDRFTWLQATGIYFDSTEHTTFCHTGQFSLISSTFCTFSLLSACVCLLHNIWQLIIVKPNALQMYTLPFEIIHRNDGWHSSRRNIRMKCRTFSKREKIAFSWSHCSSRHPMVRIDRCDSRNWTVC